LHDEHLQPFCNLHGRDTVMLKKISLDRPLFHSVLFSMKSILLFEIFRLTTPISQT